MIKILSDMMGSLWGVLGIVFAGLLIYGLVTGTDPRSIGKDHRSDMIAVR